MLVDRNVIDIGELIEMANVHNPMVVRRGCVEQFRKPAEIG